MPIKYSLKLRHSIFKLKFSDTLQSPPTTTESTLILIRGDCGLNNMVMWDGSLPAHHMWQTKYELLFKSHIWISFPLRSAAHNHHRAGEILFAAYEGISQGWAQKNCFWCIHPCLCGIIYIPRAYLNWTEKKKGGETATRLHFQMNSDSALYVTALGFATPRYHWHWQAERI